MQTSPQNHITLLELNYLVKQAFQVCFPEDVWVKAETSDVRIASNGHCYLEFIQKDAHTQAIVAKARGNIWSSTFRQLRHTFESTTGQTFTSGLKVLVRVRLDFHEQYGYALNVQEIDPTYTIGDMIQRRREILEQLKADGVAELNKELPFPVLPQRIAIISSASAAGYEDFLHQLHHNEAGYAFYTKLFPAIMQGERTEESILHALDTIFEEYKKWDVVVIIRGGGASSDLTGFDTYSLAAGVAQFPLPVITGIGHERDDTVLDFVANVRMKTPTAVAEFLIGAMAQEGKRLEYLTHALQTLPAQYLNREEKKLTLLSQRLPLALQSYILAEERQFSQWTERIRHAWSQFFYQESYRLKVEERLARAVRLYIEKEQNKLTLYTTQLKAHSPEHILKLGYSITTKDGKVIRDSQQLAVDDKIETRLHQVILHSTITHITEPKK